MFVKKEVPKYQLMLEEELENALRRLKTELTGSEEYAKTLTYVERLHDMILYNTTSDSVSKDTFANICANLLGIFLILQHERVNVISRNALSFVTRTSR